MAHIRVLFSKLLYMYIQNREDVNLSGISPTTSFHVFFFLFGLHNVLSVHFAESH